MKTNTSKSDLVSIYVRPAARERLQAIVSRLEGEIRTPYGRVTITPADAIEYLLDQHAQVKEVSHE